MNPFPICERCGWYRDDCTCGPNLDDAQRARLHGAVEARHQAALVLARVGDVYRSRTARWWDAGVTVDDEPVAS